MITPLSESMKKGSEPLRSFSDLAQFLGHIQPIDPEEEKRRRKQEKLAKKRDPEDGKAKSPDSGAPASEASAVETIEEPSPE